MTTCRASSPSSSRASARGGLGVAALCLLLAALPARADDTDALDLKSAPVEPGGAEPSPMRLFAEAAAGSADRRAPLGSRGLTRASLDLSVAARLGTDWRAVFSDRLDHTHPAEPGKDSTLNSLREAYVSWAGDGGNTVLEAGRINLRLGPAYGYNPTDFFRDGALRTVTTLNPITLRENRMGSVMLRAQRLWQGGSVAISLSPKLESTPSGDAFSLDLGSTNQRNRGLVALNTQWGERVSTQLLLYKEAGLQVQPGASITALLSDALVAHGEWSSAREPTLYDRTFRRSGHTASGQRAAAGLTYTTQSKLSVTLEAQYNGLALNQAGWNGVAAQPAALGAYLFEAARRQDLAVRQAWMLYVSKPDLGVKNLDLTALVRANTSDHSTQTWAELRYHWSRVDLALQLQANRGGATSQYGMQPDRTIGQLLVAYHFQ